MTREEIIKNLKYTMEKHKNDNVPTFGTNIFVMCKDILDYLKQEPTTKNDLGVDCISRKAVLEKAKSYNADGWDMYTPLVVDVEDIEELPSVTPQEPRWIPVSERLPTKEEYIANSGLFIVSDGNRTYVEFFDVYNYIKYFRTMNGFRVDRCVTAWMPLPKAYREVEE